MKKSLITLSVACVLSLSAANTNKGNETFDLSWNEIMNEVETQHKSLKKDNVKMEEDEATKKYIKSRYHVNSNKQSAKDRKEKNLKKQIEIGFIYRAPVNYNVTSTNYSTVNDLPVLEETVTEKTTSSVGVHLTGGLDFFELGIPLRNVKASVDIFDDSIDVYVDKRWYMDEYLHEDKFSDTGFFGEAGGGVSFQTKAGLKPKNNIDFIAETGVGYNWEDWQVKSKIKVPVNDFDKTNVQVSVGYRF